MTPTVRPRRAHRPVATGPVSLVASARHVGDHRLRIRFHDGSERTLDFGPFVRRAVNPMTAQFRPVEAFRQFRVVDGVLEWGEDREMSFNPASVYRGKL